MSTLYSNDWQASWKQCVWTNTSVGGLWTRSLEWIVQSRTGLRDWYWISFKLHELQNLQYIFYMIRNQLFIYTCIWRPSSLCKRWNGLWELCWTGSHNIQIYHLHPSVWGAQVTCVAAFLSVNSDCIRLLACFLFLLYNFYNGTQSIPLMHLIQM
jgi:hypothetical protein